MSKALRHIPEARTRISAAEPKLASGARAMGAGLGPWLGSGLPRLDFLAWSPGVPGPREDGPGKAGVFANDLAGLPPKSLLSGI